MASFEDKVEALRRLKEKREARQKQQLSKQDSREEDGEAEARDRETSSGVAAAESTATTTAATATTTTTATTIAASTTTTAATTTAAATAGKSVASAPAASGAARKLDLDTDASSTSKPTNPLSLLLGALGSAGKEAENGKARPDPAAAGGVGEADALFCSGHCHEHGLHGCSKDIDAAAEMYEIAAEEGHAVAQWRLGELYEFGRGKVQDSKQAAHWYRLSAEAGNAQAQSGLALLLQDGKGVEADEVEAFKWHKAAADQGHALSQYCLAECLAAGRGCSIDKTQAEEVLQKSASQGFGPAIRVLERTGLAESKSAGMSAEDESLMSLAQRIASQLGDLDDDEADAMLDQLLSDAPGLIDGNFDLPEDDSYDEGDDAAEFEPVSHEGEFDDLRVVV